jgi:hypothetical protein
MALFVVNAEIMPVYAEIQEILFNVEKVLL